MKIESLKKHITEHEKDLGEDERGRPMIVLREYRHWTYRSDEDVRDGLQSSTGSWYNCFFFVKEGSKLEEAILTETGWETLPGLCGVRSTSEDGREFEFCWR